MTKTIFNPYRTTYISPPSDTLLEALEERELSVQNFAYLMGESVTTINEIIAGKVAITPELALKLEQVLDIPASFWNNRERNYREALAKLSEPRYALGKFEAITVYAFLAALLRLKTPLSPDLQRKIKDLRETLVTDIKDALATLRSLAEDNSIKPIYKQIRQEINQRYQLQEAGENLSVGGKEDTEALSELLVVLVDVVDAVSADEEAKELAYELDELFERLF